MGRFGRARLLRVGAIGAAILAACEFSAAVQPHDGAPVVPDASACPGSSTECIGSDVLRTCEGPGATAVDRTCSWGCRTQPFARCAELVPAGGGVTPQDVVPDPALLAVTLAAGTIIDGDDGRIGFSNDATAVRAAGTGIISGIDYQARAGDTIAVFRFKELRIDGALSLTGAKAIALVADGDITIDGVVDAQGGCAGSNAGPGGFRGGAKQGGVGSGPGGGSGAANANEGGGGGGHGAAGGSGGGNALAAGGTAYGDARITMLVGGAGGGGGGGGMNSGSGGGGGGAVQLVSNGRIVIGGGINAGGCGGQTGVGGNDGGGGGGAGGTILVEGKLIEIAGTLAVNGGGGGGGDATPDATAAPGARGSLDRVRALGFLIAAAGGGAGGAGAVAGGDPGLGGGGIDDGGGGGGAIGRIRLNSLAGSATVTGELSPHFDDASSTCTQATVELR